MLTVALTLARRAMILPLRQLNRIGPNSRWFSSQALRRGELFVAAQAASRMNSVVGKPGMTIATNPMPRLTYASRPKRICAIFEVDWVLPVIGWVITKNQFEMR